MLLAHHAGTGARHFLEQKQLRAAKPLAAAGRRADRAMVFDQQPVGAVGFGARHVALGRAHRRQLLQPLRQRGGVAGLGIDRARISLALDDQALQPVFAKQLADRADELHRELRVGVGEAAIAGLGQSPVLVRAACARDGLLPAFQQARGHQLLHLLAGGFTCYFQGLCQRGGRGRALGFDEEQDAVSRRQGWVIKDFAWVMHRLGLISKKLVG